MVMIDKFTACRDKSILADFYSLANVKFTMMTNKSIIPNNYRGAFSVNSIIVKIDIVFYAAISSKLYLMRPGNIQAT